MNPIDKKIFKREKTFRTTYGTVQVGDRITVDTSTAFIKAEPFTATVIEKSIRWGMTPLIRYRRDEPDTTDFAVRCGLVLENFCSELYVTHVERHSTKRRQIQSANRYSLHGGAIAKHYCVRRVGRNVIEFFSKQEAVQYVLSSMENITVERPICSRRLDKVLNVLPAPKSKIRHSFRVDVRKLKKWLRRNINRIQMTVAELEEGVRLYEEQCAQDYYRDAELELETSEP